MVLWRMARRRVGGDGPGRGWPAPCGVIGGRRRRARSFALQGAGDRTKRKSAATRDDGPRQRGPAHGRNPPVVGGRAGLRCRSISYTGSPNWRRHFQARNSPRPYAALRQYRSWPKPQIRITQLASEGSPPPGLRLIQAKLSRNSNQIARGRFRRFESNISQAGSPVSVSLLCSLSCTPVWRETFQICLQLVASCPKLSRLALSEIALFHCLAKDLVQYEYWSLGEVVELAPQLVFFTNCDVELAPEFVFLADCDVELTPQLIPFADRFVALPQIGITFGRKAGECFTRFRGHSSYASGEGHGALRLRALPSLDQATSLRSFAGLRQARLVNPSHSCKRCTPLNSQQV